MKRHTKHTIKKPVTAKYNALFRVLIVCAIIAGLIAVTTVLSNPKVQGAPMVCFKHDNCVKLVGVMDTEPLRKMGLMNKPPLAEDEGMLFVFPTEQTSTFWMKDVSFPIDIVWLDKQKRVVKIEKEVPPCPEEPCPRYPCNYLAKYVVELPSGFASEYNMYMRDQVEFKNTRY